MSKGQKNNFNFMKSKQISGNQDILLTIALRRIKAKRATVFPLKEYLMAFLLHLNEDFDDDLLLDSLDILDCL